MTQYGFYFDSTRCTGCRTCDRIKINIIPEADLLRMHLQDLFTSF